MFIKINKKWVSGNLRQRQIVKARMWKKAHMRKLRREGKRQELFDFIAPWTRGWEEVSLE